MKRKLSIMKKSLAVVTVLGMAAGLLAGCGKGNTSETGNDGVATIEWWTPNWDEVESREMVEEFEKEHKNIKVELVITDWDTYKSKISTAISANGAPQLFTILLTDVAPFAKKDLLEPLDRYEETGIDFSDILTPALDITTIDNEIYGVPFRYDGSGIYYNVDLLSKAGYDEFPTNWDTMAKMAKELTSGEVYGFAWPLGNQANAVTRLIQQLYTYDGDVLNEDETECMLNSDASKRALTNIVSSIEEGYASPSSAEIDNTKMREMFGSGQLAFNFTGPFDIETLKEDYPDLNFKTAVIPGNGGMGCTTANGWSVAMAKKADNKDAAAKFLAYITQPENQARLTDSFPASKTAMEMDQFASEEMTPFIEQLNNSRPEPVYDNWAEMEPIIYEYMQNAVSGKMTVDEACEGMTNDINTLLGFH
ncbi:ABC transporter substrate-binding protein [Novisyntrophococcus fermenticellae]|uniref:ABC transporter substrate-binding protein n=1 Tax=Novisyntrophococcus fermenticellae TaxID=2068655 RepID=UPI001E5441F1|nr:sugar ABC transporter substrate-binding protein [Novisyntrophococcus fermenticellae]